MTMTEAERAELVNAARAFERIVAERRATFVRAVGCKRDGNEDGWVAGKDTYWESKGRAREAERLLASRICGPHDFVRVDDVVYMAYSDEALLRIPLKDIPELAEHDR